MFFEIKMVIDNKKNHIGEPTFFLDELRVIYPS